MYLNPLINQKSEETGLLWFVFKKLAWYIVGKEPEPHQNFFSELEPHQNNVASSD
jgi:hypothetical protein